MERVLRHPLFTASRVRFWALKFFLIDEKNRPFFYVTYWPDMMASVFVISYEYSDTSANELSC